MDRAVAAGWRAHALEHVLVREHARRAAVGVDVFAEPGAALVAQDGLAGLGNLFVPAGVVGVRAGIDDVANGSVRQPLDGCEHSVGELLRTRIHDDGADRTHLDGDVRAGAGNHVEIRPDLYHLQIAAGRLWCLRARTEDGAREE